MKLRAVTVNGQRMWIPTASDWDSLAVDPDLDGIRIRDHRLIRSHLNLACNPYNRITVALCRAYNVVYPVTLLQIGKRWQRVQIEDYKCTTCSEDHKIATTGAYNLYFAVIRKQEAREIAASLPGASCPVCSMPIKCSRHAVSVCGTSSTQKLDDMGLCPPWNCSEAIESAENAIGAGILHGMPWISRVWLTPMQYWQHIAQTAWLSICVAGLILLSAFLVILGASCLVGGLLALFTQSCSAADAFVIEMAAGITAASGVAGLKASIRKARTRKCLGPVAMINRETITVAPVEQTLLRSSELSETPTDLLRPGNFRNQQDERVLLRTPTCDSE